MDYFSKFLRPSSQPSPKVQVDHEQEFHKSWNTIKETLMLPDERQLTKGISSTNVPAQLRSMVDSLVWESTRIEDGGTGACLEYLLKNDVLGTLVRLSETDRPSGIQVEVLRTISNMVVLLDEQFLVHTAVHKAVFRLLRTCVGDDMQEQLDGRNKVMGAAGNAIRAQPSEHEEDLVNLLCILCSRIRTYRELLMIFFHDKHWGHSEPLFSVDEEDDGDDEDEDEDEEGDEEGEDPDATLKGIKVPNDDTLTTDHPPTSPTPSHATITAAPQPEARKPEYEFLLFNYLLRFVHREGPIGEFARAGLLFLMDVAMSPGERDNRPPVEDNDNQDPVNDAALALAEYILDGDFSDVLAAGLGAVYSLLPTKLGFFADAPDSSSSDNTMKIGGTSLVLDGEKQNLQTVKERSREMGIEDARSPDFKAKIDHFLTMLVFLQDVLRRNVEHESADASALVGTAIVQSILDTVRRIFLENVLYPSILECSDADGSAVAIMSYIDIMVRTLREGPLADLLVDFLISEDNDDPRFKRRPDAVVHLGQAGPPNSADERKKKHRRRQSTAMTLLEMEAPESRKPSDYFTSSRFTLKDLLLTNLRSRSQVTATTAMHLLQTLLIYYPQLATDRILVVIPDSLATAFPHPAVLKPFMTPISTIEEDDEEEFTYPGAQDVDPVPEDSQFLQPNTTYSTHEREMGLYMALISRVDPSHDGDSFSTGYEYYLHDALVTIQSQPIYWRAIEGIDDVDASQRFKHRLNVNDPTLSLILEKLTTFFSNSPEFNVGLTGVLSTLVTHPDRSLAGWLTFGIDDHDLSTKQRYDGDSSHSDGDDRSIDFEIEEKLSTETNHLPAASLDNKSRPIIHAIFHSLITQLERYRHSVENFDKFLIERRRGLLFSENLSDALNLVLDLKDEVAVPPKPVPEITAKPKPKPKASATSSFVAFLSPRKSKPAKPVPIPAPPPSTRTTPSKPISASPFGSHYQHTSTVKLDAFAANLPKAGSWTPAKRRNLTTVDEDVFGSVWGERFRPEPEEDRKENAPEPITLSQLLDNVVILEESIKELVAIIHARRSLGIDSLRYV